MSKEYLPHIFEEFSREKTTTENKIVGTGLGLPIVKSMIELMGGSIQVESTQGTGTKFTVTVSLTIASKEDVYKEPEPKLISGRDRKKDIRILLAEDNELNAEIAIELLTEAGFLVDRVADGQECCEQMERDARRIL
ncbi:MAG: ATP-binding protein [Lachnospiraceae bacterium]